MNLGMESDVTNPNFQGAIQNPWKALSVQFYMNDQIVDQMKSREQGKKVYATVHVPDGEVEWVQMGAQKHPIQRMRDTGERLVLPFVRIQKPGDSTTIIEEAVREDHKQKWPEEWLYFATQHGLIEGGANMPGWKIEDWPHVNGDSETVRNLKYLRFFTVELIAGASDAQVQRLGMGGQGLREAAKRALQEKMRSGLSDELAAKDRQLAEQAERLKKLEEIVLAMNTPSAPQPAQQKPKGGRPKGSKNKPKDVGGEQLSS